MFLILWNNDGNIDDDSNHGNNTEISRIDIVNIFVNSTYIVKEILYIINIFFQLLRQSEDFVVVDCTSYSRPVERSVSES